MSVIFMRDRWYADVKVRLLDGSTKRVQRVSPVQTKKGAVKFERQLREAVLNGEYNVAKKRVLCFADFVSDFITYSKTHNKPSTVENKIIILNNELLPCFGKMRLDQISVRHIESFKAKSVAKGRKPKTVNNYLIVLQKMLQLAVDYEELVAMPRIKKLKTTDTVVEFLSEDEVTLLINATEPQWRAMVVVALNTGLRLGELLALAWSDVDFTRREITVRHNNYRGEILFPKSNKQRVIPMNDPTYFVLRGHKNASKWLWPSPDGVPAKDHFARSAIKRAWKKAGLRKVWWHLLRHTFASNLASAGVPIISIQQLLGHSTVEQTMRYAHLAPDVNKEAVKLLEGNSRVGIGLESQQGS